MNNHTQPTSKWTPPRQRLKLCVESIDELRGFVDTLRDSTELTALTYDRNMLGRLSVFDYVTDQMRIISTEIALASVEIRQEKRRKREEEVEW